MSTLTFAPEQYELIDFGNWRKLERFGGVLVDRPSMTAAKPRPKQSLLWAQAQGRFDERRWHWRDPLPEPWSMTLPCVGDREPIRLELRATDTGQVGVFPEQLVTWEELSVRVSVTGRPLRILNLFAYTGASTLVAARAGAEVTHVDAARPAVGWAKRNAELSGISGVRWIVDDAVAFVRRELRRGQAYDGVVLDPPSYGHGPRGQPWRLVDDLAALVQDCVRLLVRGQPSFLALSCHTTGVTTDTLAELLDGTGTLRLGRLQLATAVGRSLDSGLSAWVDVNKS